MLTHSDTTARTKICTVNIYFVRATQYMMHFTQSYIPDLYSISLDEIMFDDNLQTTINNHLYQYEIVRSGHWTGVGSEPTTLPIRICTNQLCIMYIYIYAYLQCVLQRLGAIYEYIYIFPIPCNVYIIYKFGRSPL